MFRFTIRELVLVTAVVAVAVGWGIDRYCLRREVRKANDDTTYVWSVVEHYGNYHYRLRDALDKRGLTVEETKNGQLILVGPEESQ
jgi:hypothetical protein